MKTLRTLALALAVAAATASTASAETRLTSKVFTASPDGFLVTSTLIMGEKDAVLIDGQLTLADAHRLVATIIESKKNLTTVYVTHSHPDHYFGLEVIKQAFPKVKIVALPATITEIKKTAAAKVKQWAPVYGTNLTTRPIVPAPLKGNTLTLEGQTLEIHGPVQGDEPANSYVWIPSTKTVVVGDIAYQGVFPWTAETNADSRKAWLKTLDEVQALGATTVVAGHKNAADARLRDDASALEATRGYLKEFDMAVGTAKTAEDLEKRMKAKFPTLALDIVLHIGATAVFPPSAPPPADGSPKK
jgi:glyoxylase-like metal-dependent hydrolase (beta-lactamase superfamily II)